MADDRIDQLPLAQQIQAAEDRLPRVRTGEELDRLGEEALLQEIGGEPGPARIDVRLHGAGVIGHRVPVRRATAILGSLQEALTSIAQAVVREPTARGVVERRVQDATELIFSPAVSPGSVVFHLSKSPDEQLPLLAAPDAAPSLIDRAVSGLLDVMEDERSGDHDDPSLASRLRVLGPRTAKHLNDLVTRVVSDDIDVELTWRGRARPRTVDLARERASLLRTAISINEQEVQVVTVLGRLRTISTVTSADLVTEDERRYKIAVPVGLRPALGRHDDHQVEARLREVTKWSTSTGVEKKTYELIEVGLPGSSPEGTLNIDQALAERPTT